MPDAKGILIVALFAIVAIVGLVALISTPQSESLRPAKGNWDFVVSGCWAFCSHYRIEYFLPPAVNTSSTVIYSLNFTILDLQGTTDSAQLHAINVTISNEQNAVLYSLSFTSSAILRAGEVWGPVVSNFTLTDTVLGLQPEQTTTVRAGISVQFDEIAVLTGWHSSKKESTSNIPILVTNPSKPAQVALSGFQWASIMPFFFFGSLAWAVTGLVRIAGSVPRYGSYGWRNPETGRFMSSSAAFVAIISVAGGILLWLLSALGTPGTALSFGDMLLGEITHNIGISAPLSIIFFVIGSIPQLRK